MWVKSGGADSPRQIKLRQKPSTGQWFLNDIQCLSDIRIPTEEDKDAIQEMQKTFTMGANMNAANYDIQKTMARGVEAAGQHGGAGNLFGLGMGMNMVGNTGLGNMTAQSAPSQPQQFQQTPQAQPAAPANSWTCKCGQENTGKFCMNCGSPKPVSDEWTCSCGAKNKGKFCSECGNPRS